MKASQMGGVIVVFVCGALVAGCGAASASTMEAGGGAPDSGGEIVYQGPPLSDEESTAVHDFDQAVSALEATPMSDCGNACERGASVCGLAERICAIADRHRGMTDVADRCTDGRRRCESARRSLAQCACVGT